MSIPVLVQVYDEVRRLAIAGSVVAPGDFRLKKFIAPLEQAGQKAPVFSKVAQAAAKVVESNDQTSADSLLELSTLINAILYTQGETGIEGKLAPIPTTDLGLQVTQTSARVLKPLLEALTTTGSGRLEIIKDAQERGAFKDLRLIKAALSALDDSYSEIADFVSAKILPLYGTAILPELRAKFDQKGRGGHVRRLSLMHQLDPAGTREIVKQALEEGSKEVKVAAIECLGTSSEDLVFLLDQVKSRAKDVRQAALKGLAQSDSQDAVTALRTAFAGNDIELAVAPLRSSRNPDVLKFAIEEAARLRDELMAGTEKDAKEVAKRVERFLLQLECLRDRDDQATEKFLLETFGRREKILAKKGDVGGADIRERLVSVMLTASKPCLLALADAHASLTENELPEAFQAAYRVWSPEKVFDEFSPYLKGASGKKKRGDPSVAKQTAIAEALSGNWRWKRFSWDPDADEELLKHVDPKWLELAVELKNMDLVQALARPGHAAANQLLSDSFNELLKKSKESYELRWIVGTMINIQHPEATDALIAAISKTAKGTHSWGLYWLGQLIPGLPKEALPKIEALLPTLPDKAIDQLMDYVSQFKSKTSTT